MKTTSLAHRVLPIGPPSEDDLHVLAVDLDERVLDELIAVI
jgi:hypothetical protein